MTSGEVSGSTQTLKQAIDAGEIEAPGLLEWNAWQKWRRDVGKRPSQRVDGRTTSNTEEAALWKATMEDRYGSDWSMQLMTQVAETQTGLGAEADVAQASTVPSGGPAAADVLPPQEAQVSTPRARTEASPGSGNGPVVKSPGSGAQSPVSSVDSRQPGTPGSLNAKLLIPYDPAKEPIERYLERTSRIAAALNSLGNPIADGVVENLQAEAEVLLSIYESAPNDRDAQNERLKEEFAFQFLDIDGTATQFAKLTALENVLARRGFDPARLRQDLTTGDGANLGGASSSQQGGGARPVGAAQSAGRVPDFPTASRPVEYELTPPKLEFGPKVEAGKDELESLREETKQLRAEKAAADLLRSQNTPGPQSGVITPGSNLDLGAIFEKQNELMEKMLDRNSQPKLASTIKVEPRVTWPKLSDDAGGGREVEDFYNKFEGLCMLANNGNGMADREMLVALKQCISGSRLIIYENVVKERKDRMHEDGAHGEVYAAIKERFYKFLETGVERQLRVRSEWNALYKHKQMSAIQFEAAWERACKNMEEVGLGVIPAEKFIAYIQKVGPAFAEKVRLDRRARADGAGGTTVRQPETWEECHEVLVELEVVKAGERAFNASRAAGQEHVMAAQEGNDKAKAKRDAKRDAQLEKALKEAEAWKLAAQKGKGKGKKGKGTPDVPTVQKDPNTGRPPVCFRMKKDGKCDRPNCPYSHHPADTGRTPSGALTKAAKAAQAAESAAAAQKGKKGKASGKGKGDTPAGKDKSKMLCKHVKDGKKCPNHPREGGNCQYCHVRSKFDKDGKYTGKKSKGKGKHGRSGGQEEEEDDDGWTEPLGYTHNGGPAMVVYRSEEVAADPEWKEETRVRRLTRAQEIGYADGYHRAGGSSAAKVHESGKQQSAGKALKKLEDLPSKCFKIVPRDISGFQFHTRWRMGLSTHDIMLDGGSSVNSTTEELVLQLLNENAAAGIRLDDKRHPIKALERWNHQESIRGVAGGVTVELLGSVVINVTLLAAGAGPSPDVNIRFKVCQGGKTDWVGWIIGARALDSPANGGLGFIPMQDVHHFSGPGVNCERSESPGGAKPDACYAITASCLDDPEEFENVGPQGFGTRLEPSDSRDHSFKNGVSLVYDGEHCVLGPGEGAWVPVAPVSQVPSNITKCVLPCSDSEIEAVPGLWNTDASTAGTVCVVNVTEIDVAIVPGEKVAEIHEAAIQTRVCQCCGNIDTDAWLVDEKLAKCRGCGNTLVGFITDCKQCGATEEECCVLSYAGCDQCKPERLLKGKVRKGPAAQVLASAAVTQDDGKKSTEHPVFHIVEEPGGIKYLTECEVPTEEYNDARVADLIARHPKLSAGVAEHIAALEPFLDVSILAGFSYGVSKAHVFAIEAVLLGHKVNREGSAHDEEKTQAIVDFAPLKDATQVRQFIGCTNWVRRYLAPAYATAAKILGEYMKPKAEFPPEGLGAGTSEGCKAVKAIKLMCKRAIQLSTLDEASAIDGSRPLEQIADACGIAWGATHVQMTADLTGFKVLAMVGKGFTPPQQAWPAITLEGYAQLEGKRAQKKILGPMRSLCWTDHANMTKQQAIELVNIDIKLLRWISEIVSDGSEVRSLAGRSARLGDGTSRNPADREALLEQRSKDMEGMIGQVRGFSLDGFLSDYEEPNTAVPWGVGDDAWVSGKPTDAGPQGFGTRLEPSDSRDPSTKFGLILAAEGVQETLKILYVPDYVPMEQRLTMTGRLHNELSRMLPGYNIHLAIAEGPFEDDDGVGAHFEAAALHPNKGPEKQIASLKVDLHVSVAKLARSAAMHQPRIIFGEGQGAVVAIAYGSAGCLEEVFATRNFQPAELPEVNQAWGNVAAIIVYAPRLSKRGLQCDKLQAAAGSLFTDYPVPPRRTLSWVDQKVTHYNDTKTFLKAVKVELVASLGAVPFAGLLKVPADLMWEHSGRCPCGKRCFLFGQCPKCMREELSNQKKEESAEVEDDVPVPPDTQQEVGTRLEPSDSSAGGQRATYKAYAQPIRRGPVMQYVHFLTAMMIWSLVESQKLGPGAQVLVQDWKPGSNFRLPCKPKAPQRLEDLPYRMSFVVECLGDVLVLQNCVEAKFEKDHVVPKTRWYQEPHKLLGRWEPTESSDFLDAKLKESSSMRVVHAGEMGPVKRFVQYVMMPIVGLLKKWPEGDAGQWQRALYDDIKEPPHKQIQRDLRDLKDEECIVVVFGRNSGSLRWNVTYSDKFHRGQTSRQRFKSGMSGLEVAQAKGKVSMTDCFIVWGLDVRAPRKVVTIFNQRWMVYAEASRVSARVSNRPTPAAAAGSTDDKFEGPVPNTKYVDRGSEFIVEGDDIEPTAEGLRYYTKNADKRKEIAEEARADIGESDFKPAESDALRVEWISAQRADKSLMRMFNAKELAPGYRIGKHGLLEREVSLPSPAKSGWVPIVPDGMATANLTWKRWLFQQFHVGILGAHRNAEKTYSLMLRQVWWPTMKQDVTKWWESCLTCIRFRKMPQKQEAVPVVPTNRDCWEEVMIDLEGPNSPADKAGCKYTMTYICCLCHALLIESSPKCNGTEVRRMFANCIFRSGTIPTLVRSDRGPELKNALMAEYASLLGIGHRFGTPWRPMEQGLVESRHIETQKIMGMLVKDVMQCFPNEVGELLHVVEFIVYNTPGPHGLTPRDIDRRWSLATPLEKELQPFTVAQFEPVTEYAKGLFKRYREVKVRVQGFLQESSQKRADLANRHRRSKGVQVGDEVVLRDPRQRKAGGRSPYRQPYTDPALITEIHGNKCTLRKQDGTTVEHIHLEDVMKVPENARNLEKDHIQFDEPDSVDVEDMDERRSPGMMLEDRGKKVAEQAKALAKEGMSPGKIHKIHPGNYVVYKVEGKPKVVSVGQVTAVSAAEATVVIHRHKPVTDHHLRLYWRPLYVEEGQEVLGSGATPAKETVPINRILFPVQIHDGVLGHAAARRLDQSGYRYDSEAVGSVDAAGATYTLPERSATDESMCQMVEKFCGAGKGAIRVSQEAVGASSHPVVFSNSTELQKWLRLGVVDFAEIFKGHGELTVRVCEAGCSASDGFDVQYVTYDRCWFLETEDDQNDCAFLIVYCLQPKVIHCGTPCTKMCLLGSRSVDDTTHKLNEFTRKVAEHQHERKRGVSIENPKGSLLFQQPAFVKTFGTLLEPKPGWRFYRSEGCQFHVRYPGADALGQPINKPVVWLANFDLSALELRCKNSSALVDCTHEHAHARGTMRVEGEGTQRVAQYTGRYNAVQGSVYAKACERFCAECARRTHEDDTASELQRLADKSPVATGRGNAKKYKAGGVKQFLLKGNDECVDLDGVEHRVSPLQDFGTCLEPSERSAGVRMHKPVDQFHKVATPEDQAKEIDPRDISRSAEAEALAKKEEAIHENNVKLADAYWSKKAKEKDWDCVKPDLSVYKYCGKDIKTDPRRTEEYRDKVVEGLGFKLGEARPGLTQHDVAAIIEVLRRKAGAFWIEGEPRTALKYILHDTIPTGPPCRTPPHRLKGEEADWVDEQLQKDVITGQLVRGNSEWASPPFSTKDFAEHRRQRKRRLVVDYRRVNARILRAVYFVRSADGVVNEVAGSMFMTLVDACKGFNQIANTRRAREMLAILARSGQYLPVCLTFGPTNGPEDFAFATDRVFAPGRGRKMRFCTNWQIYADDITIRSGRWVDGTYYTDEERVISLAKAKEKREVSQVDLEGAFRSLGFNPSPLGADKEGKAGKPKRRPRTKGELNDDGLGKEAAADHSPYAHLCVSSVFVVLSPIILVWVTLAICEQKAKSRETYFKGRTCKTRGRLGRICILLLSLLSVCIAAQAEPVHSTYYDANITEVNSSGTDFIGYELDPSRVSARVSNRPAPAGDFFVASSYLSEAMHNASQQNRRGQSTGCTSQNRGRRSSRGNTHGTRNYFISGRYAREYLSEEAYNFLRRNTHKWRIDQWPRHRCISWMMILAARHNRTGQWSGDSGSDGGRGSMQEEREVSIAADGFINWQDFLRLRGSEYLGTTRADLEAVVMQDEREAAWKGKQRFCGRWYQGRLIAFAAQQGHTSRASKRIDMDLRLLRLDDVGDMRIPPLLYHGTSRDKVSSIFHHGIVAGGKYGDRTHVHMVGKINGTKDVSGVRSDADTIIVIDGEAVRNDRHTPKYMSGNQVILMPHVRREFLLHSMKRDSGDVVHMPKEDGHGNVIGGRKVQETVISGAEAQKLMKLSDSSGPWKNYRPRSRSHDPEARGSNDPAPKSGEVQDSGAGDIPDFKMSEQEYHEALAAQVWADEAKGDRVESRPQGFGTCLEPSDSRAASSARSASRKCRPERCLHRPLYGTGAESVPGNPEYAKWQDYLTGRKAMHFTALTNLPVYTGNLLGVARTNSEGQEELVFGRRVDPFLKHHLVEGQKYGPILQVVHVPCAKEYIDRTLPRGQERKMGFVQVCIRATYLDNETMQMCAPNVAFVWVTVWGSHNANGMPRGIRYAQEWMRETPLRQTDTLARARLRCEIRRDGMYAQTTDAPPVPGTEAKAPAGDSQRTRAVVDYQRVRPERPPRAVSTPPPRTAQDRVAQLARGMGKPTESTKGVYAEYAPHGAKPPSKAPPVAEQVAKQKQMPVKAAGGGSPAVAKITGTISALNVEPTRFPRTQFPVVKGPPAAKPKNFAKSLPDIRWCHKHFAGEAVLCPYCMEQDADIEAWKRAGRDVPTRPRDPLFEDPKQRRIAKSPSRGRSPGTARRPKDWGQGPNSYVRPPMFPDPMNKVTKTWWDEVERSPMGIEKPIAESKMWWPNAEGSDCVKAIRASVERIKDMHNRDFYRGSNDEKNKYDEELAEYVRLRAEFFEVSKREKGWCMSTTSAYGSNASESPRSADGSAPDVKGPSTTSPSVGPIVKLPPAVPPKTLEAPPVKSPPSGPSKPPPKGLGPGTAVPRPPAKPPPWVTPNPVLPKPPPAGMEAQAAADSEEAKPEGAPAQAAKPLLPPSKHKGIKIGGTTVMDPKILPEVREEPERSEPRDTLAEILANGEMWERQVETRAASYEAGGMVRDEAWEKARAHIADERGILRMEHAKIRAREKETEDAEKFRQDELQKERDRLARAQEELRKTKEELKKEKANVGKYEERLTDLGFKDLSNDALERIGAHIGDTVRKEKATAEPLPHWCELATTSKAAGSVPSSASMPGPVGCTVPLPKKRAFSMPPPPPTETQPRVVVEDVPEAKSAVRDGPSGPPARFVPTDAWTIDETRKGLDAHVEREARSRSRPKRSADSASPAKDDPLPDVRVQGFGTCLEPSDSRGGSEGERTAQASSDPVPNPKYKDCGSEEGNNLDNVLTQHERQISANDDLSDSGSSIGKNSTVETFLAKITAGDNEREKERLRAALQPVDLRPDDEASDVADSVVTDLEDVASEESVETDEAMPESKEASRPEPEKDELGESQPQGFGTCLEPSDSRAVKSSKQVRAESLPRARRCISAEPVAKLTECSASVVNELGVQARIKEINEKIRSEKEQFVNECTADVQSRIEEVSELLCKDCGISISVQECMDALGLHPEEVLLAKDSDKFLCAQCTENATASVAYWLEQAQCAGPKVAADGESNGLEGDLADLDWIDINASEYEDDGERGNTTEYYMTPILTGAEAVRLLNAQPASHDLSSRAAIFRTAVQEMHPEIEEVLVQDSFTDIEIYEAAVKAGVELASGSTDTESVCDYDSGLGNKSVRKDRGPYLYAREAKEAPFEHKNFRREYAPLLFENEAHLMDIGWCPKYSEPGDQPSVLETVAKYTPEGQEIRHDHLRMSQRTKETDETTLSIRKDNVKLMIRNDTRRLDEISSLEIDYGSMKGFFEDLLLGLDKNISDKAEGNVSIAVDKLLDTLTRGYYSNHVGQTRTVTVCGECHKPLTDSERIKVCSICNCWVHCCKETATDAEEDENSRTTKDCFARHVGSHVFGVIQRGIRRGVRARDQQKEAEEAKKRASESKALKKRLDEKERLRDADTSDGSFIHVTSESEADEKLAAFHAERPKVTLEAEQSRANRSAENLRRLRSETSDEEDLSGTEYCSACGSLTCTRSARVCKAERRAELSEWAADFAFQEVYLAEITHYCAEFRLVDIDTIREEIQARLERVAGRNKSKERHYEERRSKDNPTDMEALMREDPDAQFACIRRILSAAATTKGKNVICGTKWVSQRAGEGTFFAEGSAADAVIDLGELTDAYRAIQCFKARDKDGMREEATRKARAYLARASVKQLEAECYTEACMHILSENDKYYKSRGMGALEVDDQEEVVVEVPRDSRMADEGARRTEQLWTQNNISVTTLMEKRADGSFKLTVWELSRAVSHEKHRMSVAQRKLRRRVRCGMSADGQEKSLNQRINEGKSKGGPRAESLRPEGETDEPMSEGEEWCLSESELRALPADRRAKYDAYCDRTRQEREERDEEEFAEELGSGKFNWACKLCKTVNPAWKSECAGSEKIEGSYRRRPCPGTQIMSFDGSEDPLLPPRATKSGGKTVYTRYDIRQRVKRSGTRKAYESIMAYKELIARDPEGADTGEEAVEVRRRAEKGKEHVATHRRNAKRNLAEAKRLAVFSDENRWPCLHCPPKAPEAGMLLTVDESDAPVPTVESRWNEGHRNKCWKCQRSKEDLLREYGTSYWECLRCENPHLAVRQGEETCPNCKKPKETRADHTSTFKVHSISQRGAGESDSGWPTDSNASVASGYSATSSTYSAAGAEILERRHKRRSNKGKSQAKAKAKAKTQEYFYTPRGECAGSNCPYNHRPRDVVPDDTEERSPKRRPLAISGAGAVKVAAAGLVIAVHVGTAEAVEVSTMATGGGVALAAAVLLGAVNTVQRTTNAVGEMVDVAKEAGSALVNATSEAACSVIEEVGKESKRFVPIVMGAIAVVVLVGLHFFVGYFWRREPKTEMLKAGRNPRSNDASVKQLDPGPALRDRVDKVYGVPLVSFLDGNSFHDHVANRERAIAMMHDEINSPGTWVIRCKDSAEYFTYKVPARDRASGCPKEKQFYTLRINKNACMSKARTEVFRDAFLCNCGGWDVLAKDDRDRLCLHCGVLMLMCRYAWQLPLISVGPRGPEALADRSASSAPSLHERVRQLEDTWEVTPKAVRSARINESLIVRLPSDDEVPHSKENKSTRRETRAEPQQGFGTCLEPSGTRAEKPRNPQEGRVMMGRKSNKIPLVREAVVDEGALEAMFQGYDQNADNAAELFYGGLGRILAIMPSKVTHKLALFMIGRSLSDIILTAFTFDLADMVDALNAACQRGVKVKVLVDRSHALSGTTQNMPNRLAALMDGGVEVRLCRGCSNGTGIQHSKTLMIDMFLIVGSANWTNASQSNQEVSILFAMNADGMEAHARRLEQILEVSEPFSDAQVKAACEVREQRKAGNAQNRSRSVGRSPARESTEDRFRTMRKFSIANRIKRGMMS